MDLRSAYLHAPLKCDVYVCQPLGFEKLDKNGNELVWKLKKPFYGFKQSGKNCHNLLHDFLIELCLVQSNATPFVYIKNNEEGISIILVWVDDIIAANASLLMGNIKEKLRDSFDMKDLDEGSLFPGIQFDRRNNVIEISESMYLKIFLKNMARRIANPEQRHVNRITKQKQTMTSSPLHYF